MSKVNPYIFREYDIRGLADKDLPDKSVRLIGQAFGTMIKRQGGRKVTVGHDVRLSGPRINPILIEGIRSTGLDVLDIGKVATPVFYYSIGALEAQGGVMITASHNPPEYNGFKMCKGVDALYGKEIQSLLHLIEKDEFEEGEGGLERADIDERYMEDLTAPFNFKGDLKVLLDCGNGSAGIYARRIFEKCGFDADILFEKPDGKFPNHIADPTVEKNIEELRRRVTEEKYDIGIGFDGDVDRIGVVDAQGNLLYGDTLLGIYAGELLKRRPGSEIVFEVKCSQGLVEYIKEKGGNPVMWKAGHSLIKAKMKEDDAPLGGEMSGHMFFRDLHPGYDDAFYAALRLLAILEEEKLPVQDLASRIPKYLSTPEIRVECPDNKKFEIMKNLHNYFKNEYELVDIDGIRILFDKGWALIRPSNTQPVLVLRMEASTRERLEKIMHVVYEALAEHPEIDTKNLEELF